MQLRGKERIVLHTGTCDGAADVCFSGEFFSSYAVRGCINAFFVGVCVCKCVYPHLADRLSESGTALRINTDTLSAQEHTHTHVHTPFLRPLSHLSVDRVFSSSVGFLSSQADGEHSE